MQGVDAREILELDYFELIDRKILSDFVARVASRTLTASDVTSWVRQRRQSHWYDRFKDLYSAVEMAAEFFFRLDAAQLQMDSLADGIHKYTQHWFRLDQLYRKSVSYTHLDVYKRQAFGGVAMIDAIEHALPAKAGTNKYLFLASALDFKKIPGALIAYWLPSKVGEVFENYSSLGDILISREGLTTGDNSRFLRNWSEVARTEICLCLLYTSRCV